MRSPARFLLAAGAAAVATAAVVTAGVLAVDGSEEPEPQQRAVFSTTPLEDFDTSTAVVSRGPFCDRVDDRQVTAALGVEEAPQPVTWSVGDRVELGSGGSDLAHESGCHYAVPGAGEARAWVFAPPVLADQATRLVRTAARGAGCTTADGPAYGAPSLAMTCTADDGSVRASYRGLFGDAWLVCELVRPAGADWDVVDRAGRWCVGVLQAAAPAPDAGA